jgi:uncharacterized protein YunC (DUF1805 family)
MTPRPEYCGRVSSRGWPVGKHCFFLGSFRLQTATNLASVLANVYGLEFLDLVDNAGFCELTTAPTKIGVNKFAEVMAFIHGYRSAQ